MKPILFFFSLLFASCTADKVSILDLYGQIDELQGDTLSHDIFLGRPSQIIKVDTFLLIIDQYDGYLITVANLSTGETKRTLSYGQGPNELIRPVSISQMCNDGILNILEFSTSTVARFKTDDILYGNSPVIIKKTTFDERVLHLQEAGNYYFAVGGFDSGMIGSYDKNGQKIKEHFSYPGKAASYEDAHFRYFVYQSDIAISPDGQKLVQAGMNCDLLCFYRIDKSDITEHKKYFFNDIKVVFQVGLDLGDVTIYYQALYPTDNKIYTLYRDFSDNDRQDKPSYLLCFDWDGNPLKAHKIDNSYLFSIWVNETGTELYGLSTENDGAIIKYKL